MASIRDVARQAGVSPATVSRAFATPELINEQTQRRVLEAARLLDYRPPRLRESASRRESRPAARHGSRGGMHDAIGFQFFSATTSPGDTIAHNTFYAPVLAGAQAEASALGLHLLVHSTDRHTFSTELPRMVQERAVGGLLLVGTADPLVLDAFAAHVRPIVLVDNRDERGPYESVTSDSLGGVLEAARYLFGLGHRRLAFFTCDPADPSFRDRLRGFVCAHFEEGIPLDPAFVVGREGDDAKRMDDLAALLKRPDRPTAVVAVNDQQSLLALRVCRGAGLRVPDDVSLVGFDDTELAAHSDPPLTTVRVDKGYMGRLAVRRLDARMRGEEAGGPDDGVPVCHQIPVALVRRDSCRSV